MPTVLKIADTLDGFAIDIDDLEPLLPESARALRWALADAHEAAWILGPAMEHVEPEGALCFEAMQRFWKGVHQTVWGTYVAAVDDAILAAFPGDYLDRIAPETLARYPFLLQAIDSSFWLVHSTDESFRQRVEARFQRVSYAGTHGGS